MSQSSIITPLTKCTAYTDLVVYNSIVQTNRVFASFDIHNFDKGFNSRFNVDRNEKAGICWLD
ncbi:hypothetical protein DDB_G0271206 [Dictyostelium discoideum AX4]|uniref:Uncharacterized protein n=1 Tax=Dictyostelium discoideum TaxID=44689 RepID=Q55B79_DICDI|nr:hypothetical protein DDB_G0271206 [Dictyostelium discoideum AX4]EAL71733.1 hypothetical protein DDB_G0271206 [Dictyostelium discoideum AX4]|eukprot:XP_645733.1 hypothetical protein DDB_G0271206 [Dictyostelium discoideum AX4]